jgi:hypothetical protein
MKTITAILLSAILMFCSMGKTGMVISYYINKTYIAKVLCENKEVPQMQCNGKCQLKKQLSEADTQQEKEPVSVEKLLLLLQLLPFFISQKIAIAVLHNQKQKKTR